MLGTLRVLGSVAAVGVCSITLGSNHRLSRASMIGHRQEGVITKPQYYMAIAKLSEERSKDSQFRFGACIVNKNERIVSTGYNGMPNGCQDDIMPWTDGEGLDKKDLYVCHAELNAICNAHGDVSGFTMYTTLFPCNECAKIIIQSGIAEVVYERDPEVDKIKLEAYDIIKFQASRRMLKEANVKLTPFREEKDITVKLDGSKLPPENN